MINQFQWGRLPFMDSSVLGIDYFKMRIFRMEIKS